MTPPTSTRKQREIAAREQELLDAAQELLIERGYIGLTMDRLAAAADLAKGTVYLHFANKEDLVAAIAERSARIRAALFARALEFQGTPRERIGAVGAAAEVFKHLYPHHEQAERIVKTASIAAKVSEERAASLGECEAACFGTALQIIQEGISGGDLELRDDQTPQQVCLGLWNLYMGAFLMREMEFCVDEPTFEDPMPIVLRNAQVLLDGFGWQPLSTEHDYFAARDRALDEVFADEAREAGLRPSNQG